MVELGVLETIIWVDDVDWTCCGGEDLETVLPVYLISGKYGTFG